MIYFAGSLSYFYRKWGMLREQGIDDLRWFSIRGLYFIGDTNSLNKQKLK